MIFDFAAKKLISYDSKKSCENLRGNFDAFIRGLISFPLDVPGTAFHKCLQVINYCFYFDKYLNHMPSVHDLRAFIFFSDHL